MTLDQLRELYRTAGEADKPKIALVGQAVKLNPKYGSTEVGGNGFCYTCFLEPARIGRYNCETCANKDSKPRQIDEMIERVKQMKTPSFITRSSVGATIQEALDVFK